MLSVARRKYIERVPLAECAASRYCHESGELVLAPIETLQFPRVRMTPRNAVAVLRLIRENSSVGQQESVPDRPAVDEPEEIDNESFTSENE
jgi:hypothetical protein